MVLSIFNNVKSLLMSFFSFQTKLLAGHASGTPVDSSCYLYPHPTNATAAVPNVHHPHHSKLSKLDDVVAD